MSSLTYGEKRILEKVLQMSSGYVLNFSDRTIKEFVYAAVQRDFDNSLYLKSGTSKANRLRAFWKLEADCIVGKLLAAMLDMHYSPSNTEQEYLEARKIVQRLLQSAPVQDIDAIRANANDKDFEAVAKSAREYIEKGDPENGLDRLHTFMTWYLRTLCEKHCIRFDRSKPLHSLAGEYVKELKKEEFIKSRMAETILKTSISVLEAFNEVRNEHSLAHANPLLGNAEAYLISNHIASLVRFLEVVEKAFDAVEADRNDLSDRELPDYPESPF